MRRACEQCRLDLPARDGGALSALEQARVDAHLAGCPSCRAFRVALAAALDAGRAWRPTPTPAERDALYEAIRRPATVERRSPPRRTARWIAMAAVLAAGIAAAFVHLSDAPVAPRAVAVVLPPAIPAPAPPPPAPAPAPAPPAAEYQRFQPVPELELLAASGSSWTLSSNTLPWRLVLRSGELFVHFRGRPGLMLIAEAPGVSVRVTGTVFKLAATAEGAVVGVLEGRVIVSATSGETMSLAAGQERAPSGGVRALTPDEAAFVAEWLPSEPPIAPRPRPGARQQATIAAPSPSPSADALYADAERAMGAHDPATAAAALEELLRARPGSPQAGSARLDLARLYLGPLGRRDRAVALLREVIAAAPSDSDVLAARRLLCGALDPGSACDDAR
jgi:hypothetical protein